MTCQHCFDKLWILARLYCMSGSITSLLQHQTVLHIQDAAACLQPNFRGVQSSTDTSRLCEDHPLMLFRRCVLHCVYELPFEGFRHLVNSFPPAHTMLCTDRPHSCISACNYAHKGGTRSELLFSYCQRFKTSATHALCNMDFIVPDVSCYSGYPVKK